MEFFRKYKNIICFWSFLILGMLMFFHQFIFSGFDDLPGALLDARLINYILEHIYSWCLRLPNHLDLFSMPFFYPLKNTLFFSDTFLSVAPIYIFYRLFFDPYLSYGFFVMSIVALNYLSFYLLSKRIFKTNGFWSCFSAFLFAFPMMCYYALLHPQMLTQFFTIFAVLCISFVNKKNTNIKNVLLFIGAGFLFGCQFYSSFYLGFFAYLGILVLTVVYIPFLIFVKRLRKKFFIFLKRYYIGIISGFLIFLIIVAPLGYYYISTGTPRLLEQMFRPWNIYFSGSIVWQNLIPEDIKRYIIYAPWHKNNFGYVTLLLGAFGLYRINKKFLIMIIILYLFLIEQFPVNFLKFAYYYIPGAYAIRFWSRLLFLFLPFITIGAVYSLKNIKLNVIRSILIIIVFLEQIPVLSSYGWKRSDELYKMNELDKNISKTCKVIWVKNSNEPFSVFSNIDSMWIAHYRGVYSRTGFSGMTYEENELPPIGYIPRECQFVQTYNPTNPINIEP